MDNYIQNKKEENKENIKEYNKDNNKEYNKDNNKEKKKEENIEGDKEENKEENKEDNKEDNKEENNILTESDEFFINEKYEENEISQKYVTSHKIPVDNSESENMEADNIITNSNSNNDKMIQLMEKQLFYNRVLTIIFAVILLFVTVIGIYVLKFAGEVQECVDKVNVLTTESTKKLESIDVDKINDLVDRAGTTMDTVSGMLDVTNQATKKMTEILTNLENVSKAIGDVEEKFDNLFNF